MERTPAQIAKEYRRAYAEHMRLASAVASGSESSAALKDSADALRYLQAEYKVESEIRAYGLHS